MATKQKKENLPKEIDERACFRLAALHSSDAVVIADKEGVIRYANDAVKKVMGARKDNVIGTSIKNWGETMGKEYYDAMWRTLEIEKKPFFGEIRPKRPSGEEYTASLKIIPILGEGKDIRGFVAIEEDISSDQAVVRLRIRTQDLDVLNKQLAKEKAEDEALLASIGEGLIAADTEGIVLVINKAAEDLFGRQAAEVIGKKWEELMLVEDERGKVVPILERPMRLALASRKKAAKLDYYYVRKDKSRFPAAVTASPVFLHGEPIGVIEVFRDITKEKEVDKMKTEFLSVASHQLRTPLTAIRLFSEMLSDARIGALNEKQKEYLDNISQSTARMVRLVNDLLNVSRIETGRLTIEPKPVDLEEMIRAVIEETKPFAGERGCEVVLSARQEKLPRVLVDPGLLGEVVKNLLINAIRYSLPERCSVSVAIAKKDEGYVISVADGGMGIPRNSQYRVFEKFFRAENAIRQESEGTGLGLYVAKMILEASGGSIWFESEEGKGSTFYVMIPLEGMKSKAGEKGIAP